jgi:toxin CcdB
LNPVFDVDGQPHVMATQFAATVQVKEMGEVVMSLQAEDVAICNALDMLLTGC